MPDTVRDLCTEAAEELGVVQQGDALSDNDANLMLRRYQRLLDAWNVERGAVYASQKLSNAMTASLSPHTIGPSGTWVTTQRPVSIEAATLVITGGSNAIRRPIEIRDQAWYEALAVPTLSTAYPTDLWFNPGWPNGSLYFYPVPSSTYTVELWARIVLTSTVTLDTAFTLPPGYWRAHALTLAEECAEPFRTSVSPKLEASARRARGLVFDVNRVTPRLATRDAGMPSGRGLGVRSYNYLTREGS